MYLSKIKPTIVLLSFVIMFSCTKEKTDEVLLQKDVTELNKNLYTEKVLVYKMGKVCIRASVSDQKLTPELQKFSSNISNINGKILVNGKPNFSNLSIMDYVSLYNDYSTMKDYIEKTNEDEFPTLIEAINTISDKESKQKPVFLTGNSKIENQNIEHGVLSALVILSQDLGKEVSLYECSKTNPELMPNNQVKALLQFYRGFVFFEKKLLYLSENEFTNNLNWLEENPKLDLEIVKSIFRWQNLSNENANLGFNSLNHLFRGFDRLMMDREIDEKRALEDFNSFIMNSEKMGLDNELTAVVESFVYIKKEENKKAIIALKKLKTSPLLSTDEKESIDQTIKYLKSREKGDVKNSIVDKFFITKIASKFMFDVLLKVDWKAILKSQNIKNTNQIFEYVDNYNVFIKNMSKYSKEQVLEISKSEIKETSINLLDKAKGLLK